MFKNKGVLGLVLIALSFDYAPAQSPIFTCQNKANNFLEKLQGTWEVTTKDRTSPEKYENNVGRSVFVASIEGCGISETYRGTYKGKDYAREVQITGLDSVNIQMFAMDSEHGSYSELSGSITDNVMTVFWYRNSEVKRLQSKYILTIQSDNQFEFSSFLSTDYGDTWALTHERKYSRVGSSIISKKGDTSSIQGILDAYYDCISGPIGEVRDFDRLKSLFHPEGRLIYSYWDSQSEKANLMVFMSIHEFIPKLDYLDQKGFYEHEVNNVIHSFSSVTQVFSTYQFRAEDKSIEGRGITSYELFYDGNRYWILSMYWAAENDKYKVPTKYLK